MTEIWLTKNPLNRILGSILRKQRIARNLTYKDVPGFAESYVRGLEVGSFTLHVSKAVPLYNFFENQVVDDKFQLNGLIQYLALITILESAARSSDGKKLSGKKLHEEAILITDKDDEKYKKLLHPFIAEEIFLNDIDIDLSHQHLEGHVKRFLTHYDSFDLDPGTAQRKSINEYFDEVPSVYLGVINDLSEKLRDLPVRIHFKDLEKWERQHEHKFASLHVLLSGKYDPSNEQEISTFSYSYLWNKDFVELKILFVDRSGVSNLEEKFRENLEKNFENGDHPRKEEILKNWKAGISKVTFASIKRSELTDEILRADTKEEIKNNQYNAFWIFGFIDRSRVGFLAEEKVNPKSKKEFLEQGRSVTFEELDEYLKKAQQIFNLK